jgi:hypothetical protein
VEADRKFHKAIRWPNVISAMKKQRILNGENDAERMMWWFGSTEGGEISFAMLKERLKDATPLSDVDWMLMLLMEEADCDGDGKLNLRDISLILENPNRKLSMARYCAVKLM